MMVAMVATTNAQIFWTEMPTGFTAVSRGVNQISYADADNVWITVYDGVTTANVIREYAVSTNNGTSWTPGVINLGSTTLGIGCIAGVSATTAYVAAYPNTGGIGGVWKTTNSGTTWTKQSSAPFSAAASFADVVYFWDADTGVVLGDPDSPTTFEVYTTTNGGTNWVRVAAANIPVPLDGEYFYTRGFAANGNSIWLGTNKGRLFRSFDKGLTWTVSDNSSLIADFATANYAFQDNNNGLMIDDAWNFYRTSDSGATWTSEVPTGFRNGAMCHVPGTVNTYVTLGNDLDLDLRGSSYTVDGGLTWTDINTLGDDTNNDNGTDVSFFDINHGLAAGFNASATVGGIFQYVTDGPLLATKSFSKNNLFSAYISNGSLNVIGKNITNVTVYDVLGKQVIASNFASTTNATLTTTNFNTGVYLVKVTDNAGNTSTIKVMNN